jgi:uncharacterized protein (TIGR03437 family)
MRRALLTFSRAVGLLLLGWNPSTATPTSSDFFNAGVVQLIHVRIHPNDWQRLKADYEYNTYYPCVLQWNDLSIPAGVRSAGLGTRNAQKPALRVDFNRYDEDQRFLGLKSVRLKNLIYDATTVKERIVMLAYRRMGLAAPRTAHARLFVNGQYAGLYLLVESIDKPFLRGVFDDDNGYLYEYEYAGPYRFEYLGPDPSRYVPTPFEPRTHESEPNPGALVSMIRTMNMASDEEFPRAMSERLDLKRFLSQVAVENYFVEEDGIVAGHGMANFYLYQFAGTNLFQFIPWDKDRTFADSDRSIWSGMNDNVLTNRALGAPALRQAYLEAIGRLLALTGGSNGWLESEILREAEQVRGAVQEDTLRLCPHPNSGGPAACSMQDFDAEVARIIQFARNRGASVKRQLAEAAFELPDGAPRLLDIGPVSDTRPAALVPGSLISAFGQAFANDEYAAPEGARLPTELGGVSVLINGLPAPLLFVSQLQINLQVPWETAEGEAEITVVANGVFSRTITAPVVAAAPAILAVLHGDGVRISAERPAAAGETLQIYATGLGAVVPNAATGEPAPDSPRVTTAEPPAVRMGELPAPVVSSGLAPGMVGVFRLDTVVPDGVLETGSTTLLTVAIAGQVSAPITLLLRER